MLNNDLSLLDSALFKNNEIAVFSSLLESCFGSAGSNLAFFTTTPDRLEQWFPESKLAKITDTMAQFGLRIDKYVGEKGLIDQSFDLLDIISRKLY
jgi:hypothetical protein